MEIYNISSCVCFYFVIGGHGPQVVVVQQPAPQVVYVQQPAHGHGGHHGHGLGGLPFGKLHDGNIVSLKSVTTQQNLKIHPNDNQVSGYGGEGKWAKWQVHRDGPWVRFQSRPTGTFLRVMPNGQLDANGGGGKHTKFRITPIAPPVFAFESFHGGHLGINNNGEAKNAQNTGKGKNGQFEVRHNIIITPPFLFNVFFSLLTLLTLLRSSVGKCAN